MEAGQHVRCKGCTQTIDQLFTLKHGWLRITLENKTGIRIWLACGKICAAKILARAISEIEG